MTNHAPIHKCPSCRQPTVFVPLIVGTGWECRPCNRWGTLSQHDVRVYGNARTPRVPYK